MLHVFPGNIFVLKAAPEALDGARAFLRVAFGAEQRWCEGRWSISSPLCEARASRACASVKGLYVPR